MTTRMAMFEHHILPLSPPVPEDELLGVSVLGDFHYETKTGHLLRVCLLGRSHSVDAIGVTIPQDAPLDRRSHWVNQIMEHMLATLRLTYDIDVDVLRTGADFIRLRTETDEELPSYPAAISPTFNLQFRVNTQNIINVFRETGTCELSTPIALISEGQSIFLPRHYQALSLIRALEVLFPEEAARSSWLDRYQADFAAIGISARQFKNALPELRTRCAHGVSRGGQPPFTGIGYADQDGLQALLVLLRRCTTDAMRTLFKVDMRNQWPPLPAEQSAD